MENPSHDNIFIGIVTHRREEFLIKLLESLKDFTGELVVYKDGNQYPYYNVPCGTNLIESATNNGVGFAKNEIIKLFKKSDKEHLFIIEDDVLIKDLSVFQYFIDFSETTGVKHTNWNNCTATIDTKRFEVQYDKDDYMTAVINRDCSGSFQYFHNDIIDRFYIDLKYRNAWEHIDVELQLCMKGLIPPFWAFITPKHCKDYLEMQDGGNSSTITKEENYQNELLEGLEYFNKKWGFSVMQIPRVSDEMVTQYLIDIGGY